MVSQKDRELAISLIEEGLNYEEISDTEKNRWFLELLFNEETDERIFLRKRRNSLLDLYPWRNSLDGNDEIPSSFIVKLIVDTLGADIIKIREIRYALLDRISKNYLIRFNNFSDFISNENNLDENFSIDDLASIEIVIGSKISREFCRAVELPMAFSRRGKKDDRKSHEVVKSSKHLHDLMPFQDRVKKSLSNNCLGIGDGRALVVMPTGSGKTRTMIESVLDWFFLSQDWPPNIVWIADREELCEQAFATFKEVFVNLTQKKRDDMEQKDLIVPSELKMYRYWGNRDIPVSFEYFNSGSLPGIVVTSVQQLQRRKENLDEAYLAIMSNTDIFIVDEAHRNIHWLNTFNSEIKESHKKPCLMGLTATPKRKRRAESSILMKIFDSNFIAPIEGAEYDVSKMVKVLTDDKILAKRVDVNIDDIIDYDLIATGNKNSEYLGMSIQLIERMIDIGCKSIIVFTRVVEDARIIASYLRLKDNPIKAEHIESDTHPEIRRSIIQDFRNKEIRVLLNWGILTTGFDAPKTDAVIICRPNLESHDSMFLQMAGRGLRGTRFGGTESCFIAHLDEY